MPAAFLLFSHPEQLMHLSKTFVVWYFLVQPKRIIKGMIEYLKACGEIFSFVFILKTLISPWKQIGDAYPEKGFNLSVIAQTFTLNMTSRLIGLIFRLVALIIGVSVVCAVILFSLLFITVWFTFPALSVVVLFLIF